MQKNILFLILILFSVGKVFCGNYPKAQKLVPIPEIKIEYPQYLKPYIE